MLTSVGPTAARVAPVLVLLGYLVRPYVQSYMDAASVAEIASSNDVRWMVSSLLVAVGYAGLVVAASWVGGLSLQARRWWGAGLVGPLMALASALLAFQLGAMAAATVGAGAAGADPALVFKEVQRWEGPLIATVLIVLVATWIFLTLAVTRSGILAAAARRPFVAAAVVAVIGLVVPSSIGEYASAGAMVVALWLLVGYLTIPTSDPLPAASVGATQ